MPSEKLTIGSIIGLKPEFEERYIILHRHTFPGVQSRIRNSGITDYSIFLLDGVLFSHMLYDGNDFVADMAAMGEDETTREWWKLTDPMQSPLDDRKIGEWWKTLEKVIDKDKNIPHSPDYQRTAFRLTTNAEIIDPTYADKLRNFAVHKLNSGRIFRVFRDTGAIYVYAETDGLNDLHHLLCMELGSGIQVDRMKEVFHTESHREINPEKKPKVIVTGCFDMLHSGHVAFLTEASGFGDLYVCIGSDVNVNNLKGRPTVNSQEERKYMIEALSCVHECRVNTGWGIMDFEKEIREIAPDIFIVNEDGHTPAKQHYCQEKGIEYKVLKRIPHGNLPVRSTTALRTECTIPFRIDLAGGWLDQPFVSELHPGSVLTISIEPTLEFNERSGMASSTRRKAIELWRNEIPHGDPELLARLLFSFENPPGTKEVAGSQDALGIVLPGLNKLDYSGNYWADRISSVHDEDILQWLERSLHLVTLGPRVGSYSVLENTSISAEGASCLASAAEKCWKAILEKDIIAFGEAFRKSFEAQVAMFPNMIDESIMETIDQYKERVNGWKLSGAGGGGYLILISDQPIPEAIRIRIRRREG